MSNHATPEQRNAYLHRFYLRGTIHLAATADAADTHDEALCGRRLIGAIDTEADANCGGCLRHAEELEASDAYDAQRDAEAAEQATPEQPAQEDPMAAADPGAGIAIDSEAQPAEEEPCCPACRYFTGHTSWCPVRGAALPPEEADQPTGGEPRELIGCEARDLKAGDIIVAAGCDHRDGRGCDHRLYAAFDLLLQDGEEGERMTIWTAIADQEAGQPLRLTLPAGQRLLVQRRLPDWKIAEAPSFAASIIDLAMPELPLLCGPAGNLDRGGDLNSSWTCKRAHGLWGAYRRAAELQEELARLPRLRTERRRRNLADWIARAFVRYEQLNRRTLRELPACGHPEELRAELSVEEALPACTC